MESKYRHEFKYLISDEQIALIRRNLDVLVGLDKHVGEKGMYAISSLYFDDYLNTCFYENENGTDPREKFRIRIYNGSESKISLECKRKERGKTLKTACPLTKEQCLDLMNGKIISNISSQPTVLRKLTLKMMLNGMKPVVIVGYDRVPYVYELGNVRITFDENLYSSNDVKKFLTGGYGKRPVMPAGLHLLEVKYDEFLPDVIYNACQIESLTQTAYSKYYLCRKYDLKGLN